MIRTRNTNDDPVYRKKGKIKMKRVSALLLILLLLASSPGSGALAGKAKPTPTPAPLDISPDPTEPPEQIRHMLDIAWQDWQDAGGKTQGDVTTRNGKKSVKNKYTLWRNDYYWNSNGWCAGFVTWCMLEAEIPQVSYSEIKSMPEEAPEPVYSIKDSTPKNLFLGFQHLHRITRIPQKGFVILYGEGNNKFIHVGIVYDVEKIGDGVYRLTTLEGAMGANTVKMFVFDYDLNAAEKKNVSQVPEAERTEEESDMFTYGLHGKKKNPWYVVKFLMPWIPEDNTL